ncbi:dihydroorotase [bacterium]|nr:dihydroorotase [bacterium]
MLLLKNGRVIDPGQNLDATIDILIDGENIVRIGKDIKQPGSKSLDLTGFVVAPGFVDLHVHFREPGKEEAETISSGSLAAAAGGFTTVACMPNTQPANDSIATTQFILEKASEAAIEVLPIAAVTVNQAGEELVPFQALRDAGVVAFSDDGKPIANSELMRRALEICGELRVPVIDHCEDPALAGGGVINEGMISSKLKVRGMPPEAEEIMVSRNILLSKLTNQRVHMAHMSTSGSMKFIRQAKLDGLPVTCEVTPHHFTLTEEAVINAGTNAKMNPPLRTSNDLKAVLEAIVDGTVDIIASDHAPHHIETKRVPLEQAAFGIVGLETSVALGLDRLVNSGLISLKRFVELYSTNPARIIGISREIAENKPANLTIFDPGQEFTVRAAEFKSKSRNTPFEGWTLRGSPMATIFKGKLVWKHETL